MHDIAAAQSIAQTVLEVARAEGATRVERIHLALGAMTMLDPEQLSFWLEQILRGTIAEGAEVAIEHRPLTVRCAACGFEGPVETPEDPIYHLMPFVPDCPACGDNELRVLSGNECIVESMRVIRPDPEEGADA